MYEGYVPLWPFTGLADAAAWEATYQSSKADPWHLDPDATALSFTNNFLGFTELNRIVSRSLRSDGEHLGVGYLNPSGVAATSAILHLIRLGTDPTAPWEVVGSDDTTLTLDAPAYGATTSAPITVGGTITGVDENIVVTVRRLGSPRPLAQSAGIPAGGTSQGWTTTIALSAIPAGPLTIVAATGGHLQTVERFAITGAILR